MTDLVPTGPSSLAGPESVVTQMSRSESEVQAALAQRFPRDIRRSSSNAMAMATLNEDMAAACFYAMPRGGQTIEGPSVRLAEILAQCWGNIRAQSYIIEIGQTTVTARGVCWDLENNYFITQDRSRRITRRDGKRYGDDMIEKTCNAVCSIAYREAVFRCIGKAVIDPIWQECRRVSIGESRSVASSWAACSGHFGKMGVQESQLLARLGHDSVSQVTRDDIGTLRGLFTAIKDGETSLDASFPPPPPTAGDTVVGFGGKKPKAATQQKPAAPPPPEPKQEPPTQQSVEPPPPTAEIKIGQVYDEIARLRINATNPEDLSRLKAPELAVYAENLGLDVRGKKIAIATRIAAHYNRGPKDQPKAAEPTPPPAAKQMPEDLPVWKDEPDEPPKRSHDPETGEGLPDLVTGQGEEPPPHDDGDQSGFGFGG